MTEEVIKYLFIGIETGFALASLLAIYFIDRAWQRKHPRSKGEWGSSYGGNRYRTRQNSIGGWIQYKMVRIKVIKENG